MITPQPGAASWRIIRELGFAPCVTLTAPEAGPEPELQLGQELSLPRQAPAPNKNLPQL